jgi:crotonobetainyl-CoA hydratase
MSMIKLSQNDGILEIELAHPKVNAIGAEMSRALGLAFTQLRDDDELHVAIITGGQGPVFSAGWDLKAVVHDGLDEAADYGVGGFAGLTELFDLHKPVIAAVNGTAVGAGFELILACDIVVAAEGAEFFLPETALGVMADAGGVQRLPRKLPANIAMEMLLTGRRLSAGEAASFGLVNCVLPASQVLAKAREIARHIRASAPLAVRAIKETVHGTLHMSVEEAFQRIKSRAFPTYARMLASADREEGPKAFIEKRAPRWTGR